ncbi:hypothetical protein VTI74DRAFT_4548 [Chaetomium olivicolor]
MQLLSKTKEDDLTQWILNQVALGLPPTHAQIKELAQRVLQARWDYATMKASIIEGMGVHDLVAGSAEQRPILKKQPGTRAWTSFNECISAEGKFLSSLFIFKGKSV